MKRIVTLLAGLLIGMGANAQCINGPSFSTDKMLHFAGTAVISGGVTAFTGSATTGFWAGVAAGALRELYKVNHGMSCEYSSMAYDFAGAAAGSFVVQHWFILPRRRGIELVYTRTF